MSECIFCKIIAEEIPGDFIFRNELVSAFRDINPVAPTHILIVPNKHIASINELEVNDRQLVGYLFTKARDLAVQEGIDQSGYRLIINCGPDGGQVVPHLHLHLIGGQKMQHPMG